jgi:hypothetical protein
MIDNNHMTRFSNNTTHQNIKHLINKYSTYIYMSHFHLDSHSFLSLNSFLTSSTKSFKYGKSCNVKHHKLGLADCCLMPTQQFFSYTMARWNDDEVRFVLDQHTKLDFYSTSQLKQQSADGHVAPLGYIILIPTHPVFGLSPYCCVL